MNSEYDVFHHRNHMHCNRLKYSLIQSPESALSLSETSTLAIWSGRIFTIASNESTATFHSRFEWDSTARNIESTVLRNFTSDLIALRAEVILRWKLYVKFALLLWTEIFTQGFREDELAPYECRVIWPRVTRLSLFTQRQKRCHSRDDRSPKSLAHILPRQCKYLPT